MGSSGASLSAGRMGTLRCEHFYVPTGVKTQRDLILLK